MKFSKHKVLLVFISVFVYTSCIIKDEGFISRIHTPNEAVDWYRILGSTNIDKHFKDFDGIDWESEFRIADKSEVYNTTFLEVIDPSANTYFSVSIFPWKADKFQFEIFLGSRSITDKSGEISEQGYVRCFLLDSDDPKEVKRLMGCFFDRNYDKLFEEVGKLQALFETEDIYQNIK